MSTEPEFHAFLSHCTADKPIVEQIAFRLLDEGLEPWLDKWHLVAGDPWMPTAEAALQNSAACVVFFGDNDEAPWRDEEMRAAISQQVNAKGEFRVIPVLLPGVDTDRKETIPAFLKERTWVEFQDSVDEDEPFDKLVKGILGLPPGPGPRPKLDDETSGDTGPAPTESITDAPAFEPAGIADSKLFDSKAPERLTKLIGRDREKRMLTNAWKGDRTNIVVLVAWGGVGKTALVTDWLTKGFNPQWDGVDAFFDWSFYSQGADNQSGANSDAFLDAALRHFGDIETADSPQPAEAKAKQLAERIIAQRTLLVLDGVEPLQHPRSPTGLDGQFKDPGVARLLKCLAKARMSGLCVVTTREPVVDLRVFRGSTVREHSLLRLSAEHGAELLHVSGATRSGHREIEPDDAELITATEEVHGHALTLQLLGGYLRMAHGGDILRRDRIDFAKVFEEQLEGHAFNVMAAYERWFEQNHQSGLRQLSVLRLTGLFDRPADAGCLDSLRAAPPIPGLTDDLTDLDDEAWHRTLQQVEDHGLVALFRDATTDGVGIDAHPLVREYFAWELRTGGRGSRRAAGEATDDSNVAEDPARQEPRPPESSEVPSADAWTEGHRRLYIHLCERTEHRPSTVAGLQPLYQAIAHGCHAGLQESACSDVYVDRILRGTNVGAGGFYSHRQLGAVAANLGAVACFFDRPWSRLSPNLTPANQSWLLNEAGTYLRSLGRLTEALDPMRAGLEMDIEREDWLDAAICAGNLGDLELTLGDVSAAIADTGQSVTYADRSKDVSFRMNLRTAHADALHQTDDRRSTLRVESMPAAPIPREESYYTKAIRLFAEAEAMQAEMNPEYPGLVGIAGFRYCDLLLSDAEVLAWRVTLATANRDPRTSRRAGAMTQTSTSPSTTPVPLNAFRETCDEVTERAMQAIEIAERSNHLLSIALEYLTLGRAALYRKILSKNLARLLRDSTTVAAGLQLPDSGSQHLIAAVNALIASGEGWVIPRGLVTQAWALSLEGDVSGAESVLEDAWEIAECGPMPLYQADILLTWARLSMIAAPPSAADPESEQVHKFFGTVASALTESRRLIEHHSYGRRLPELADAEEAFARWSTSSPTV